VKTPLLANRKLFYLGFFWIWGSGAVFTATYFLTLNSSTAYLDLYQESILTLFTL